MTTSNILTRIPENTSHLQVTKFSFVIPTLPFLKYFVQTAVIPGISTSAVRVDNPFSATWRHGDKLEYDGLTITTLVDEDIRVYEETYNWLQSLTFPQKFPQYLNKNVHDYTYHDAFLTLNTNANLPNIRIKYRDAHPVSISPIQFDAKENAHTIPTVDITFRFDIFELERVFTS